MRIRGPDELGAFVIEPEPAADSRGLFARLFDCETFQRHGLPTAFPQASVSYNRLRGTLRGLHYQAEPHPEGKLVRCTAGAVFDVIVDVRPRSETFGRCRAFELSAENRLTLYIPPGLAHGFETLVDGTELYYQMTVPHVPGAERGIAWNDPDLAIVWPLPPSVMSDRDRALPRLATLRPP